MAGKETPAWLQALNHLERAVGIPVESVLKSDEYFDFLARAKRTQRQFTKLIEGTSEQVLHTFNLPSATDLRRVREQLSRVERRLNAVAKAIADAEEVGEEPQRQLERLEKQLAVIAKQLSGDGARAPTRTHKVD